MMIKGNGLNTADYRCLLRNSLVTLSIETLILGSGGGTMVHVIDFALRSLRSGFDNGKVR